MICLHSKYEFTFVPDFDLIILYAFPERLSPNLLHFCPTEPGCGLGWALNAMTHILLRWICGHSHTQGQDCVNMEPETGVTCLGAQGHRGQPAATRCRETLGKESLTASSRTHPCPHLIPDFWPLDCGGINLCSFQAPGLWCFIPATTGD